jgi:hypothetical protein
MKTGPGVNWPTAMASINCVLVNEATGYSASKNAKVHNHFHTK